MVEMNVNILVVLMNIKGLNCLVNDKYCWIDFLKNLVTCCL